MENEFVPYDIALAMKELGFDNVPCLGVYFGENNEFIKNSRETQYYAEKGFRDGILAPLYQQAFRWFREEHKLYVEINPKRSYPDNFINGLEFHYEVFSDSNLELAFDDGVYSYEEAQDTCLRKLIEIVKEKQDESNN